MMLPQPDLLRSPTCTLYPVQGIHRHFVALTLMCAGQRFGVMDEFQPAPTAQQHQAQQQQLLQKKKRLNST